MSQVKYVYQSQYVLEALYYEIQQIKGIHLSNGEYRWYRTAYHWIPSIMFWYLVDYGVDVSDMAIEADHDNTKLVVITSQWQPVANEAHDLYQMTLAN